MTATEFRQWLETYYGRGQRLAFVTDYNAAAEALGASSITSDGLENWLYRQPPQGREFERMLDLALDWRQSAKPIVKVYTISLPVTAERLQLIKEIAGDGEYAPDLYLRSLLDRALQKGIEAHLADIEARRKAKKSRKKPILITPPVETPSAVKPRPKPRRRSK